MSLDSCVAFAMEHNCGILLQRNAERISQAGLLESKMELLPTLNLYLNQYYNWGRSVDMQELVIVRNRLTRQTSGSIGASFTIFDGLASINGIFRQRQLAAAAHSDLQQAMLDVKADIAATYLSNILARLSLQGLTRSLENAERQAEIVAVQADCGARDRSDCLEMAARIADIRSQIESARSEDAVTLQQLKSYMGCSESFRTDTCITGLVLRQQDLSDYEAARPTPPGVLAARSRLKAAEYGVKAAIGAMMPTLSVSASYGTYYSDASPDLFREQLDGNRNPSVSLSMVVPIFNGGKTSGAMARARAELQENEIRLRQEQEQADLYLNRITGECLSLREQLRCSLAKRELCRERARQASQRHEAGTLTTSEWIDASQADSQAECEYLRCLCKYLFQLKLLEYYGDGCR